MYAHTRARARSRLTCYDRSNTVFHIIDLLFFILDQLCAARTLHARTSVSHVLSTNTVYVRFVVIIILLRAYYYYCIIYNMYDLMVYLSRPIGMEKIIIMSRTILYIGTIVHGVHKSLLIRLRTDMVRTTVDRRLTTHGVLMKR